MSRAPHPTLAHLIRDAECAGKCRQGRPSSTACLHPKTCRTFVDEHATAMHTQLHRIVSVVTHPTDEELRKITPEQWEREDAQRLRWLLAVIAMLIVALFAYVHLVAGLPVMPS